MSGVFVGGIVSIIIFYILILAVGIWAGKKQKSTEKNPDTEELMLAGRNIGLMVGIFTMTATWVGGGFINGAAEIVFTEGVVWCMAPLGDALSLLVGGLLFAKKMRHQGYVTMIDPFQRKYGERMGGLLFVPALFGEIFWSAAILSALGGTISVIMDIDDRISIIISAIVVVIYTLFGGLYSVAYTDVLQLICIFVGLIVTIPFALNHRAVGNIYETKNEWLGHLKLKDTGYYIDLMLVFVLGGIPWQVYFQRVLSSKTETKAMYMSFFAAFGCILAGIPPIMIGAIAKTTDWNQTEYASHLPLESSSYKLILPLVMRYLTPSYVSFFGLGAVSAAVMSSADSSVLSASSMFARNIWKLVFRQKANEREILWVMRIGIFLVAFVATLMGLTVQSVYSLWFLCSDLVYVVLFPQLFSVVHLSSHVNTYGSSTGFFTGIILRLLAGEAVFNIPPILKYPLFDEETSVQKFPFRTLSMLICLCTILCVSALTNFMFKREFVDKKWDIFRCVTNEMPENIIIKEEINIEENNDLYLSSLNEIIS